MTKLIKDFERWMEINKSGIKAGIVTITGNIVEFAKKAGEIAAAIDKVVSSTVKWENALKGVAALIVLFNPLLMILTLMYSILDLVSRFQGEGSWQEKGNKFMHGGMGLLSWLFGAGTQTGEQIREWYNKLPKITGRPQLDLEKDIFSPLGVPSSQSRETIDLLNSLQKLQSQPVVQPQIHQEIHSNADAREVARIANEEIQRGILIASQQVLATT